MYHHPGEYVTDFCIVQRGDLYHLFHIRGERWTWPLGYKELDLGHATSTDLRTWTPQPPVFTPGDEGTWDECGTWAPDIIEVDGTYYMYYTGSDVRNNQAIGLATSTDLLHWTRHESNPVVEAGPWSDRAVGVDVACRDAMVFADRERGRYLLYYTATMADGRACIGLSQSTDLVHWEDLGPTYIEEDRSYNRLESAYLVPHPGPEVERYYLFYSAKGGPRSKGHPPEEFDHFDIVYLVSDDPTGGWQKPANHELLVDWTCASEHPTFNGQTYMLYIIQEEIRGIWGASILSDPKRVEWMDDGSVRIREHLPEGVPQRVLFDGAADGYDEWVQHGGSWQFDADGTVQAPDRAEDAFLMNTLWGADLAWEAEVQLSENARASLIVRGNPSAMAGYRVELDAARGTVSLYMRFPEAPDELLQQRPVKIEAGLESEHWHALKVVVQGGFFDVYVDDTLQIVRHHTTYPDGCFGLHASGSARFRTLRAIQYTDSAHSAHDWQTHCRPYHLFPAQPDQPT